MTIVILLQFFNRNANLLCDVIKNTIINVLVLDPILVYIYISLLEILLRIYSTLIKVVFDSILCLHLRAFGFEERNINQFR